MAKEKKARLTPEQFKTFEAKLKVIKANLTKDRDDLYDLIEEHRTLLKESGEALNYLDAAVEELSGSL